MREKHIIDNPELGSLKIVPDSAFAGEYGTWELIYTPGIITLETGGRIRIYPPFTYDVSHNSCVRWDYGTVTAYHNNAELKVNIFDSINSLFADKYHAKAIEVKIISGNIHAPETLSIVLGDQRNGGKPAKAQWLSGPDMPFYIAIAISGSDEFIPLAAYPKIRVYGAEAERLKAIAPSTITTNENFSFRIKAEDALTNISDKFYKKPLDLNLHNAISGPDKSTISVCDRGQKQISGFSASQPGIYRIEASDGKFSTQSNPVAVDQFSFDNNRIFWGEIHAHTELSDGIGSENRFYEYARDEAWLDFAAISEHRGGDKWWECCRKAAEKYNDPGKFVTLLGYETAWKLGHCNVYSRDTDLAVHAWKNHEKALELVRQGKAILIPHHPNDPLINRAALFRWKDISPEMIHAVEICQMRGSFEKDELGDHVLFGGFGKSVQDALKLGFRPGFIGGTDNHCGRPGSTMQVCFHSRKGCGSAETCDINRKYIDRTFSGLTAVFAPKLTREAVFDAIRERHCYATTGERILLDFKLNNLRMGESGKITNPANIMVKAAGTAPITQLSIIKNNQDAFTASSDKLDMEIEWQDLTSKTGDWYYLRVKQNDGHYAWSSPIWID